MIRKSTVATLVLVALVFGSLARANHVPVEDGSSEAGRLDVRTVTKSGGRYAKWEIDTYHRWTRQAIWDRGYLTIHLDTVGTKTRYDYYTLIWAGADDLHATLFRDRAVKSDVVVRSLRWERSGQRSIVVTIPLRYLKFGKTRTVFSWYVRTSWSSDTCDKVCFDWAPDSARNGIGVTEPRP